MTTRRFGNSAVLVAVVLCFRAAFGTHDDEAFDTERSGVHGQDGACSAAAAASLLQMVSRRSPPRGDSQIDKASLPSFVFYINMNESTDRRRHMESALAGYPGQVERVEAITPTTLPTYTSYYEGKLADHLKWKVAANQSSDLDAIISIYLSHVLLWERLERSLALDQTALIFEDDVEFQAGWKQKLSSVMSTAPKDWTVLKVCGHGYARASDMVDMHWAIPTMPQTMLPEEFNGTIFFDDSELDPTGRAGFYLGTCGYLVNGSTISSLLKKVRSTPVQDIDGVLMEPEKTKTEPTTGEPMAKASSSACRVFEILPDQRVFSTGTNFESTYDREFQRVDDA